MTFESETAGSTLSASSHTDAFVLGSAVQTDRQTDGRTSRPLAPRSAFLRCSATSFLLSAGRRRPDHLKEAEMKEDSLVSWFSCEECRAEQEEEDEEEEEGTETIRSGQM